MLKKHPKKMVDKEWLDQSNLVAVAEGSSLTAAKVDLASRIDKYNVRAQTIQQARLQRV